MKLKKLILTGLLAFTLGGTALQPVNAANKKVKRDTTFLKQAKKIRKQNKKKKAELIDLQQEINDLKKELASFDEKPAAKPTAEATAKLAELDYNGTKEITVNDNVPNFSKEDLSTDKAPWDTYSDLDKLNRVGAANAMLNRALMPSAKREGLTWNPTGWHNKKLSSGWLYNRSHLIGYQLTGQNNNPKNLMTGTRELNSPEMLAHEMDVAYYLRSNPNEYVRYRVTPIFRGDELLARGVQMEAQSVHDDDIKFNVYIFNVQDGVTLNYTDGTSQIHN